MRPGTLPPAPAARASLAGRHLYWIDWLRFLAAAAVLLDHACVYNWQGPTPPGGTWHDAGNSPLIAPIHLGRQAVTVFFVLSGMLVGGRTLQKILDGTFDATVYAADRISRVYVPLFAALLLSMAIVRVLELPFAPWQFVGCLFGVQGIWRMVPTIDYPLWTLAYEQWFYLLAGCVAVAWVRPPGALWRRLAAWGGAALALGVLCFRLEPVCLLCWLLGATGLRLRDRLRPSTRGPMMAAGLLLMYAGAVGFHPEYYAAYPALCAVGAWLPLGIVNPGLLAVGTLLFAACVMPLAPATRAGAWLERTGTRLAAYSYTLYLVHCPVVVLLAFSSEVLPRELTGYSLLRLGLWLAVANAVALIFYRLFEAQTPRVRGWLRERLSGRPGAPAPADVLLGQRVAP